jgi:hypothetical protein
MNTSTSIDALRRANPRRSAGFATAVDTAGATVRAQIAGDRLPPSTVERRSTRRRVVRLAAVGVPLAAVAAAVAVSTGTSPGGEDALAAVRKAAAVTAASADQSGTAVVRVTHNGSLWSSTTIRWHDDDLAVSRDVPRRPGEAGSHLLVVRGKLYGVDPIDGEWVMLGHPESIDPGSGATPHEYLAATREDVGGVTLRRISDEITEATTTRLADGSTVFNGKVAAEVIARETGFKGDQPIRVLPFGVVAHGEAADPHAQLGAAVTVGADGVIREITVTWGNTPSAWQFTVTYSGLGATPAPVAPAGARPLREQLRSGKN